ncbi:LacI family DNA-binding transcriptional regulator [Microlunatus speluncae]|uniref:LacI family DNA-binding transcriptional regulator n=1 Tax=Microlunatus speluncae TaxID=2594267 RepID=UPI001375502D|nr:LacI family DNA-binding transcriptional regulator [Microlunatus speluncae]
MSEEVRPTLRDVAAESDVTYSTVSRILRGRTEGYRPETVRRVQVAAAAVGYRPNTQARGLRLRRHQAIAMLVPDLDNFGFTEVLRGVQETCLRHGYTVLIAEVRAGRADPEPELPNLEGVVDGVLAAFAVVEDPVGEYLERLRLPTVFVQRGAPDAPASAVLDEPHNVDLMIDHLVGLGHRRIAHVSGSLHSDTGVRRHAGFEQSMRRHGRVVVPEWRRDGEFTFAGGKRAVLEILAAGQDHRPTAIAVDGLVSALGVLSGLRERGLHVPADLSVITIDEHVVAAQTTPPLTTIKVPQRALGHAAATMLLDLISGGSGEQIMIKDRSQLVLRSSTAPPAP